MLTPTEEADPEVIREKLENKAEGMVTTAEMGYTQGYADYKIIENVGRYFLVMQQTPRISRSWYSFWRGWRTEETSPCPVLTQPMPGGQTQAVCAPGIFLCRGL